MSQSKGAELYHRCSTLMPENATISGKKVKHDDWFKHAKIYTMTFVYSFNNLFIIVQKLGSLNYFSVSRTFKKQTFWNHKN